LEAKYIFRLKNLKFVFKVNLEGGMLWHLRCPNGVPRNFFSKTQKTTIFEKFIHTCKNSTSFGPISVPRWKKGCPPLL